MFRNKEYLTSSEIFPYWCDTGKYDTNDIKRKLSDGTIEWEVCQGVEHYDHIEMSGSKASLITSYGVDRSADLKLHHHLVFPRRRTIPNDTHASLSVNCDVSDDLKLVVNGIAQNLIVDKISFDGTLIIEESNSQISKQRQIFISPSEEAIIEKITISSNSSESIELKLIAKDDNTQKLYDKLATQNCQFKIKYEQVKDSFELAHNKPVIVYKRYYIDEVSNICSDELKSRYQFFAEVDNKLRLDCPNVEINELFKYSKRRLCESIFETKAGLMHSPGGGRYYAALWTNDQCEYANPVFPYINYQKGIDQSINCYQLYTNYMDPDFKRALVTSIISEGESYWNGAGDRADAAMYGSGASRFLLALNDQRVTNELLPALEWCREYCERKTSADGILLSDSDELENRFESGSANLSGSSLLYDFYINLSKLYENEKAREYECKAKVLKNNINEYFGSTVEGFDTYKYYAQNDTLRAWICLPLAFDIMEKAPDTIAALCSDKLWTKNGLRTDSQDDETFWDRATLYAIRAIFNCSDTTTGYQKLTEFSQKRIIGNHIPYVVEAYPEGNQKHLSAESALYINIFLYGILGIQALGSNKWSLKLNIPAEWEYFNIHNLTLGGVTCDLKITRVDDEFVVTVMVDEKSEIVIKCQQNERIEFNLEEK